MTVRCCPFKIKTGSGGGACRIKCKLRTIASQCKTGTGLHQGRYNVLFYNKTGSLIDPANLRKRVFYKCLEKAGLRQIRIHDLRHTYATLRIQAGHNIADVSKQLGHHSIKITVDTYYHWMPGSNKSEVDQLDSETAPICTLSAPSHDFTNEKRLAESTNPL